MTQTVSGWVVRFTRDDGTHFYSRGDWPIGYAFFATRREARMHAKAMKAHGVGRHGATAIYATLTLVVQG